MAYTDYKIKEVSQEDSFLGDLRVDLYNKGSNVGFLLGDFYGLLKEIEKLENIELIKETQRIYDCFEIWFNDYFKINDKVYTEWEWRGKPLSIEIQTPLKNYHDKEDEVKSEYYDR